ncbi:shikimate dehydrogenase [Cryobacterium melibiosiphilum]|uniref:Shikimate dehydrogenase n=1 Tax=Cryobacterium melibiosiphilum TaxID=995039 RepID=A0A3A5MH34_9MICO|nr:shikimate dehydrogenase [Cryobacterium melibiosiphilum]RJT89490.1 shikimate dehydrogenase [Cryobacterium melibiosiphilum]
MNNVPRLAVLGSPIGHSQSPALHRAAYRELGLDWQYDAADVGEGALAAFLTGLGAEWRGLSLTMPLKREVLPLLDDVDRIAQLTNAVNTVLIGANHGRRTLSGFNTDVPGLVRALGENGVAYATHVTILGAGATAASAMAAAAELGAETVDVVVRTPAKATTLVELGHLLGLVVTVSTLRSIDAPGRTSDLVISTLPGGTVLDVQFPSTLRASALLFDVAYSPWPSALAESWANADGTVASGLGLLLHQALIQVRIFVAGDPFAPLPREEAVLSAMRAAL